MIVITNLPSHGHTGGRTANAKGTNLKKLCWNFMIVVTCLLNCWQSEEFISRIGYLALGTVEVVVDSVVCCVSLDYLDFRIAEGGC